MPPRRGSSAARALAVCAALALGACREDDEERAARAYDSFDFATARALAAEIAAAGNPRGHELLALMAAQGLGQDVDYAAALAAIDRAVAGDGAYAGTREAILERIAADRAGAEEAFAAERYERAFRLAGPLAAWGDEAGRALETTLITGHFVALPGSDMSWRDYWGRCSGNNRFEDEARGRQAFAADCEGRAVTWDGIVTRSAGEIVQIKMDPGRPGARPDLTLELAAADAGADADANRALARIGAKVRFAGTVAARGSPNHPDTLGAARLVGPAPLTPREAERAETRRRQNAASACQRLVEAVYRDGHMPAWAVETERRVIEGGSPRSRAFSLHVGIASGLDRYERAPEGGWRATIEGTVTLQSVVARMAQVTEFTADCTLDAAWRRGADPARHGALTFVAMTEPVIESAAARMRR